MTDTERSRIVELQHQGYGYKKISTITGLPLNTVKSFCTRHPVQIKELPVSNALCRNCLAPLEQTPHKRKRLFCSDTCRMAWWNAHPERVQRKAYYTLTCRHCVKQFESYGNSHEVICHTPKGGESHGETCKKSRHPNSRTAESFACLRLCPCFYRKGCHATFAVLASQLLRQNDSKPQRVDVLRRLQQ